MDLNSIDSVIEFASNIQEEFDEIYALVNNAGVFFYPQELTEDGFDVTLQTNYLGPFVLTHYLLKALKSSEHARIVNVCSEAHRYVTEYDLKAVLREQKEQRNHFTAYGVTKLGLLLLTRELSKRLISKFYIFKKKFPFLTELILFSDSNVIINAVNPGNVETEIYRYFPPLKNPILYAFQWPIRMLVVKNARQGAQTALHCLVTSQRSTGQYLSDCRATVPSPLALNGKVCTDFYNLTLEILDIRFETESEC